jgi:hypothetical protein
MATPECTARWGPYTTDSAGVIDGTRTRDSQYHKLELYQLSYDHHDVRTRPEDSATFPAKLHQVFGARFTSREQHVRIPRSASLSTTYFVGRAP